VDTRGGGTGATGGNSTGSNLVYYDLDTTNHVMTITWDDVGHYSNNNTPDAFQLQLIGSGNGNFDIVFRYEAINWTSGDGSGGTAARAGYSAGDGDPNHYFELPQSGDTGAMLALPGTTGDTGIPGVYVFQVESGNVTSASVANGTIQFTDADSSDTHTATAQAIGSGYVGTFVLDDPAGNGRDVIETNSGTPGAVAWHFNLTSNQVDSLPTGGTKTQSYAVTVDDGHAGGQATQVVAITWGSAGHDQFVFQSGIGADTVLNFKAGTDSIDFNPSGPDAAHIASVMTQSEIDHITSLLSANANGDAVLNFGHGDTVTLAGVTETALIASMHAHTAST
jgi:VCBS repeat-containing protein